MRLFSHRLIVLLLTRTLCKLIVTGKSPRTRIIPIGITLLYIPNAVAGYIQWVVINLAIGTSGRSMKKYAKGELNAYSIYVVWNDICIIVPLVVSDGLLVRTSFINLTCADISQIWRCFKVWNSSPRVIALSLFFLLAETGNSSLYI